jgi:hypothetical protein
VFLAGSIEMGVAEFWQDKAISNLSNLPIKIFNPRRLDWDSSWEQVPGDNEFSSQVNWELSMIGMADVILFYFDPDTKAPVTLLELGLTLGLRLDIIVVCPNGYWRKGNVEITCARFGVPVLNTLEEGIEKIKDKITFKNEKSL